MSSLPRHIAIIMDGNGRWAQKRFLPRSVGHRSGVTAVRRTVEHCLTKGIRVLTLFAFSSENWRRPPKEVSLLMDLLAGSLERETTRLCEQGVRVRVIGDFDAFSPSLRERITLSESVTSLNTRLHLVIAANYGGRWDITQAARHIAQEAVEGRILPSDIDNHRFASYLSIADLPEPDLFIRTGGEQRISNFLLWQLAYTELYFTPVFWPDFDEKALDDALEDYASRQRRFGFTGEQVDKGFHQSK